MVAAADLDLAIVMEVGGKGEGELRVDQLFWAATALFRHDRRTLPLALFPSPCTNREVALEALARHGIAWRMALASSSPEGILAAVKSGIAVTVLGQAELKGGLRDVGSDLALPCLPQSAFRLVRSPKRENDAVEQLEGLILESTGAYTKHPA